MTRGGGSCPQAVALGVPDDARCHARTQHACTLDPTHEGAHLCACGRGWGSGGGVAPPPHGTTARYEGGKSRPACRCPECRMAGARDRRGRQPDRYRSDGLAVPVERATSVVAALLAAGWTETQIAEESGVARRTVVDINLGNRRTVRPHTVAALVMLQGREAPPMTQERSQRISAAILGRAPRTPVRLDLAAAWLGWPPVGWWDDAACTKAIAEGQRAKTKADRSVAAAEAAAGRATGRAAVAARAVATEARMRRELDRPTWATHDWWHSGADPDISPRALAICARCPVSDQCLAADLIERARLGHTPDPKDVAIRGGLLPHQLRRLWALVTKPPARAA